MVKDHTIFEAGEILKKDGTPYLVYTPYSKAWKKKLAGKHLEPYPSETQTNWLKTGIKPFPGLQQLGFEPASIEFPPREPDESIILNYHKTRNIPSIQGTTRMGVHLRFGTVSIRRLVGMSRHQQRKISQRTHLA